MNYKVENDERLSKYNYGSIIEHSIETVALEKRLMFDYAKKTEEANVGATSCLKACYDRQMPELCGLVEGTIGANRNAIELIFFYLD